MIKAFLFTFLIGIGLPLQAAEDIPDLPPNHLHLFTLKLPLDYRRWAGDYDDAGIGLREQQACEGAHALLKGLKFKSFDNGHPIEIDDESIYGTDSVLGAFDKAHRLKRILFHQSIYNPGSLELKLDRRICPRNHILRKVKRKREVLCNPLSWEWVNYALEYILEGKAASEPRYSDLLAKVPTRIERHGLQKAMMRIATVTNKRGLCSFYVIYDTEEEKVEATQILEKLKAYVTKTYGEWVVVG